MAGAGLEPPAVRAALCLSDASRSLAGAGQALCPAALRLGAPPRACSCESAAAAAPAGAGRGAVGFSVSVAQYLPTLFAGAGWLPPSRPKRSGWRRADRRLIGVYGFAQAALPLAASRWPSRCREVDSCAGEEI